MINLADPGGALGTVTSPWVQGLLAALATFILEDPTTVACGLLVADGKMPFNAALIGLTLGIAVGDLGLYLIGRYGGRMAERWRLVPRDALSDSSSWLRRNLVAAVIVSRFVPGLRIPTYAGAGFCRAPVGKFFATALGASLVWTFALLLLIKQIGEAALPALGQMKWIFGAGLIALIACMQLTIARRNKASAAVKASAENSDGGKREWADPPDPGRPIPEDEPALSIFEFWPAWLFYLPVTIWYLLLAIRHRGLALPALANPRIHCGGFVNESKLEILEMAGPEARRWIAPAIGVDRPAEDDEVEQTLIVALGRMAEAGLAFPVVAKPDVGQRGVAVRVINDANDMREYLRDFPAGRRIVIQALAPYEREAGVFYVLTPGEASGRIFSITMKFFPEVTGDGRSTLSELILSDRRAGQVPHLYLPRWADELDRVPAAGERKRLVFTGNHAQGAIFRDGCGLETPELLARFEEIARAIPEFYFGRFDVRFSSLDELRRGEAFTIVEVNGAGSEATHIWDARARLFDAWGVLFRQFDLLFKIGAANRARGFKPYPAREMIRDILSGRNAVRSYRAAMPRATASAISEKGLTDPDEGMRITPSAGSERMNLEGE